ncbi:hypothetical protein ACFOWA_13370 [Pedobacter lithocola]|uniref:Lipoprotein n=1 Tax=Pedobacter lithocola TaxID=1908239 RepID=A0ABV8PDF0_9SPHI
MKNITFILLVFCSGCRYETSEIQENVDEEVQVILNTFENAAVAVSENDSEELRRTKVRFPPKGSKEINLSKIPKVPLNRKHLYLTNDTLNEISQKLFNNLSSKQRGIIIHPDSIGEILKNTNLKFSPANLTTNSKKYEIRNDSSVIHDRNFNGNLIFTRVVFNKNKTRACYVFSQSKKVGYQNFWSMGTIIYAMKVNGIWVFDREEELWIT